MKIFSVLAFIFAMSFCKAQNYSQEKTEIQNLIKVFGECIVKKDTATFKNLFTENSFNWIAVLKKPKGAKSFTKTFQDFHTFLLDKGEQEEIFKNIHIENDDAIASVTFDYSFLSNHQVANSGKEFWQLIKTDGQWKIVSLIYTLKSDK